jgi:ATP-dependent helicase YprA (DUF1998 family)
MVKRKRDKILDVTPAEIQIEILTPSSKSDHAVQSQASKSLPNSTIIDSESPSAKDLLKMALTERKKRASDWYIEEDKNSDEDRELVIQKLLEMSLSEFEKERRNHGNNGNNGPTAAEHQWEAYLLHAVCLKELGSLVGVMEYIQQAETLIKEDIVSIHESKLDMCNSEDAHTVLGSAYEVLGFVYIEKMKVLRELRGDIVNFDIDFANESDDEEDLKDSIDHDEHDEVEDLDDVQFQEREEEMIKSTRTALSKV